MNKTVNINLAGTFFHIDEDAYARLQRYLEAIRHSFSNTQGRDEIISDIEARIAELFNEKVKNDRQVISIKEVEEVITIMGQPEDYMVDEEIFEDEPKRTKSTKTVGKQLFRDTENGHIGGVSSGLGHYLGIEAIWVRLLWVLLTIFSSGAFVLIYIAFWIFVPEAKTTADKLAMRGEEVTVSNIEKKIREGFHEVSDSIKNVDYEKYGKQASAGANSAATTLGGIIKFCLKLFVKFIGILLLLIAGSTLIALFVGLFAVGTFGIIEAPWTDYIDMVNSGAPIWIISLLTFFAVGIPFFFLFVLGLKILVKNLKSIGRIALLTLLGLWLISVIGLVVVGVSQATNRAFDGEVAQTEKLTITPTDTVFLRMRHNNEYTGKTWRSSNFRLAYEDNKKIIVGNDIRLIVKSTKDSLGKMEILKFAEGKNYTDAKDRASNIEYSTSLIGNQLLLDSYFTTDSSYGYRDQEVQITLYLPEGTTLYADDNTSSFHKNYGSSGDILNSGEEGHFLKVMNNETLCEDCPVETWDSEDDTWEEDGEDWDTSDDFNARIKVDGEEVDIRVNDEGIEMRDQDGDRVRIDSNRIEINNES
ncbi:PspC domain-containing protein [Christiangramia echinicola]|uniref:Phage shock protein PspC (Stress-responsive transcriptional regulator) n=1 Tax=Christiangramia echinicola TaxID=279359 RepID=A0A1H1KTH4_9FLAO|nr:PspC domain-containing protein [Christiangramia echinicola]SDR65556.1 Phage shock protein PspC (stress-responsive transcriptional regulator) [Christiangramia echinicola]